MSEKKNDCSQKMKTTHVCYFNFFLEMLKFSGSKSSENISTHLCDNFCQSCCLTNKKING